MRRHETDYVVGEITGVNQRGVQVSIAEDTTALLRYSALLIVSSPLITWSRSSPFSYEAAVGELSTGSSITVVGSDPSATSLLLELLSRKSGAVAWQGDAGGPMPSNWKRVARALGAVTISAESLKHVPRAEWFDEQLGTAKRVGGSSEYHTIITVKREPYLFGEPDDFGRIQGEERVFLLDSEVLRAPGGPLFTNLMTCVFATGKFPLELKKTKSISPARSSRVYNTKHARKRVWKAGSVFSGLPVRSLETRLDEAKQILSQLAGQGVTH